MKRIFGKTIAGVALATAMILSGLTAASAQPTLDFDRGGFTRVKLDPALIPTLSSLGVGLDVIAPGTLSVRPSGIYATFEVPRTGTVDLSSLALEIVHAGGLSLSGGGVVVEVSTFIIENLDGELKLTALVKAGDSVVDRIPLFDIALTEAPEVVRGRLTVEGAEVTLAEAAAGALNGAFGVDAFVAGIPIGTATVRSGGRFGVAIRRR